MDTLESLRTSFMELTRREREDLLASVEYAERDTNERLTHHQESVIRALLDTCDVKFSPHKFISAYGKHKFAERVESVLEYMNDSRKYLLRAQTNSLIQLCFRSLASELRRREIPVTPKTLLDNVGSLPNAVDIRFPGYAAAGLLHRVVGA